MTTGTSADIVTRVKAVLPKGWWAYVAPYQAAIMGGLADSASWCYGLIQYAKAQTRLSTAYGVWLDVFSYDFLGQTIVRGGVQDDAFRKVVQATILQERVTRAGMSTIITRLTGNVPSIFEPWNTFDTSGYSNKRAGQVCGQMGYGVGQGGYGNMNMTAQALIKIHRGGVAGVPGVSGYTEPIGGYDQGAVEYIGSSIAQIGITNQIIENAINATKPTGSRMWIAFI